MASLPYLVAASVRYVLTQVKLATFIKCTISPRCAASPSSMNKVPFKHKVRVQRFDHLMYTETAFFHKSSQMGTQHSTREVQTG